MIVTESTVRILFMCFPSSYLEDVIIDQKNDRIYEPIKLGDIIMWIGICVFMINVSGNIQRDFPSSRPL